MGLGRSSDMTLALTTEICRDGECAVSLREFGDLSMAVAGIMGRSATREGIRDGARRTTVDQGRYFLNVSSSKSKLMQLHGVLSGSKSIPSA
jgi:hypothetical protein